MSEKGRLLFLFNTFKIDRKRSEIEKKTAKMGSLHVKSGNGTRRDFQRHTCLLQTAHVLIGIILCRDGQKHTLKRAVFRIKTGVFTPLCNALEMQGSQFQ